MLTTSRGCDDFVTFNLHFRVSKGRLDIIEFFLVDSRVNEGMITTLNKSKGLEEFTKKH